MSKLKVVLLIILAVALVDFALENAQPSPILKLFKVPLTEMPTYVLVYLNLALGFGLGWIAHALRLRRKQRQAQEAASAQQQQESQ